MDKEIAVNLPYPSLDCITKDLCAAQIISHAYAGRHGELNAILQYVYHHYYFSEEGNERTANVLIGISLAEMRHLSILGEMLLKLGLDPVYSARPPCKYDFYTAGYISYSKTARKMLMDDISGELVSVSEYGEMLKTLENEDVAAVIARIKLDEELHIRVLKAELERLC